MEKISNFYKNKKVLITGVTGFKGSWLASILLKFDAKIYGIAFNPNKNKDLFYELNIKKKIFLKHFDITDFNELNKYISIIKPDIIFHLAAQPLIYDSYLFPKKTIEINTLGTLNILEVSKNLKNLKALICVTSDKCYRNNNSTKGFIENDPLGGEDPYSASKASAEIIINSYIKSFFLKKKIGVASARAGNVIGGGDWSSKRLIPDIVKSIIKNRKIIIRNPNFNRPWQHVLEPLYGYLLLAKKLSSNPLEFSGPYNFGPKPNTVTSVLEIVKIFINYWNKGSFKIKGSKFYEQQNLQLNINKSKKKINYKPVLSMNESVLLTAEWYKKVKELGLSASQITDGQIKHFLEKNDKRNKNC